MIDEEQFLDSYSSDDIKPTKNTDIEQAEMSAQKEKEQAERNKIARKRIDELKEKKRLKDLLDDEEDW
ncbi:MAG: PA3496 family putative envelope integrity protein [Colwellia sp.]